MKIAIPVSLHDKHLLPAFTECLLKMGGFEEHPVIFFPTLSAREAAYEAAEKLSADTHPLLQDFEGDAPIACSNHFAAVVGALGAMGNTDPFLWMELDMYPTAPRWPDRLMQEYRMNGKPFMGNVVDTPFNENGRLVTVEGDTMMMGCGIYPPGMHTDERIKPLIEDLAKVSFMNPRVPFDIYLRWAIKNIGVANTNLIADQWSTCNYRLEGGYIVCDSVDHGDRVVRHRGGRVNLNATLLCHGCKDGSLAKLILGEKPAAAVGKNSALEEWDDTPTAPKPETQTTAFTSPNDDGFWDDDEEVVSVKAPKPATQPVAKAKPFVEPKPEKPAAEPEKPLSATITRAVIERAMDGKKMRTTDLAKKLKVSVPDLIGTFHVNGYMVAQAGWVQSTINITSD